MKQYTIIWGRRRFTIKKNYIICSLILVLVLTFFAVYLILIQNETKSKILQANLQIDEIKKVKNEISYLKKIQYALELNKKLIENYNEYINTNDVLKLEISKYTEQNKKLEENIKKYQE